MEFNFPPKQGTGIDGLLPNASKETLDLMKAMLAYDPDDRISATQSLRHEYFRDLFEAERMKEFQSSL